jgi:3'-5' exoribonuclease
MKSPAVRELKPDEIANAVFLVQSKEIRQKRTGEPYPFAELSDKTGELEARMWDNVAEVMDTFGRDDFIKVRGQLQIYNTRPQFIVHKLRRMEDSEVDFADFFPASARDPGQMWAELRANRSGDSESASARAPERVSRRSRDRASATVLRRRRSRFTMLSGRLLEHVLSLCGLARPIVAHTMRRTTAPSTGA